MAHILVVEDDVMVALSLCDLLQEEGHTVFYAANGEAALAALDRQIPDLIIADYKMPAMDGGVMAREIRNDKRWRNVPMLMVSSFGVSNAELAAFGFNGYVQKPWSPPYLILTVKQLLSGSGSPPPLR